MIATILRSSTRITCGSRVKSKVLFYPMFFREKFRISEAALQMSDLLNGFIWYSIVTTILRAGKLMMQDVFCWLVVIFAAGLAVIVYHWVRVSTKFTEVKMAAR